MPLTINWADYDALPPRDQYDAVGKIIDEAKAAVAAKRAEIADGRMKDIGAAAAASELGITATRVYQLAARHKAATAEQTTEYGVWDDTIPGGFTLPDGLAIALGDAAESFDIEAIEADYREALNAALRADGITLAGEVFYGPYPRPEGAKAAIAAIVETVDLWEIAARHDRDIPTA